MTTLKLHTDRELIVRFVAGDQLAFELLFHRYKHKLNGFVLKLAPSQIDADEVVQNVFIKIWVQRAKIDPDKSFSSFLFTIARHELTDQLRSAVSRKMYYVGPEMIADLQMPEPSADSVRIELEEKVRSLIGELPERRRQMFELSRYKGLSYRQIAAQLGVSENTVDTQIRLALRFLRDEVARFRFFLFSAFSKKN